MIRYALKCADQHLFESWFQSAEAFDALNTGGRVACPVCGSTSVEKAIMAPQVRPSRSRAVPAPEPGPAPTPAKPGPTPAQPMLSAPASERERVLAEMRAAVEANCDYVGKDFAAEARRMHLGEAPERSIYGEARPADAKELIEDGIPVAPLPFMPQRKTN